MFNEYIKAAMHLAHYEMIDNDEPFYGEIPELIGVWSTGKSLEDCRDNLLSSLEEWLLVKIRLGLDVPVINDIRITMPRIVENA